MKAVLVLLLGLCCTTVCIAQIRQSASSKGRQKDDSSITAQRAATDGTLKIATGGSLLVSGETILKVTDAITATSDPAKFILTTDASLIQVNNVTNSGMMTVERTVTDMDNDLATQMDYVYWSSPVSGQGLQAFSPGTPANRIYEYNEATDYFRAVNLTTEPNFIPGKGYAIRAETGAGYPVNPVGYHKTYRFRGIPHNGDISISVKRSADTVTPSETYAHGYNLIGNPYPSNMSLDRFFDYNSSIIYRTAWLWTNNTYQMYMSGSDYTGNNYAVYNATGGNNATTDADSATPLPNGIVKSGQGFIVQVKTAPNTSGTLNFKNSYGTGLDLRVAGNTAFYQKNSPTKDRFWLQLTTPTKLANSLLIGYLPGATTEYDLDYDADALSITSDVFYSLLGNHQLLIQGRGSFDPTDRVPVGANFFSDGSYTLSLQDAEGLFQTGQQIYVLDRKTATMTNLSQGAYSFKANKGEQNGRFEIHYQPNTTLAASEASLNDVKIYRSGPVFVIESPGSKLQTVELFDASGRLILQQKPNRNTVEIPTSDIPNGMYILRVERAGNSTTKKVRI